MWLVVETLARLLPDGEQEIVLGDLAEEGSAMHHQLSDTLGLVIRRQLLLLASFRPWIVLLTVVLPAAFVLQRLCSMMQGSLDLYGWILRNQVDLDPALLKSLGLSIVPGLIHVTVFATASILDGFVVGFLIARLARRTVGIEALFLSLLLFAHEAAFLHLRRPYEYDIAQWPFPLQFYTFVFPLLQLASFALLPVLLGMYAALRSRPLHPAIRILVWAGAFAALFSSRWHWTPHGPMLIVLPIRLLILLAAIGPLTLLLVFQSRRLASRFHVSPIS